MKKFFIFSLIINVCFAKAQVSSSGCYLSAALINPGSTAGCGNSGTNYCNIASLYVPAFTPTACGSFTAAAGSGASANYSFSSAYVLPGGCTASVIAEFKKRAYLGIATGTGCDNSGMDGSPDKLFISASGGGVIASQGSTINVNVGTCGAYGTMGIYTSATASINPGCSNADGTVSLVVTGGTFTVGGASDRADEFITFTVNFSGTCGTNCASVLPIELTDFTGEALSESIKLKWHVATEKNTREYIIEKSLDGMNWKKVGSVLPDSRYSSNIYYQLTDDQPFKGVNYYALKDIDEEGGVNTHNIISVNYLNKSHSLRYLENGEEIMIFSDPFFAGQTLTLVDISGREVKTWKLDENSSAVFSKKESGSGMFFLSYKDHPQAGAVKVLLH